MDSPTCRNTAIPGTDRHLRSSLDPQKGGILQIWRFAKESFPLLLEVISFGGPAMLQQDEIKWSGLIEANSLESTRILIRA